MKQLKFSNPKFHDGLNLTVRRGVKWSMETGHVWLADDKGNSKALAVIVDTFTTVFRLLDDDDLTNEHDPSCRTYKGLYDEMRRVYPNFKEREIVSLVFFKKAE